MSIIYMAKSAWVNLLDSIRSKAGTQASMTVAQAASAVDGIQTGGGGGEFRRLVERTISTAYDASATKIGGYAFRGCNNMTGADFPNVLSIDGYAFASCSKLKTAIFQKATFISEYAFYSCSMLSSISFPSVSSLATNAFAYCTLTSVEFPAAKFINGFNSMFTLTMASFPSASIISNLAFRGCYNLLSVYLLGPSVCRLSSSNAFSSTPIAGYITSTGGVYGSIFVPASLYDQYISASNWSFFSSRFVSV